MDFRKILPTAGLALVLAVAGCSGKPSDSRISRIRDTAAKQVQYTPRKGFTYQVNVDGVNFEVNISKQGFAPRSNLLRIASGDTAIRIYDEDRVEVYVRDSLVKDEDLIARAKQISTKALDAIIIAQAAYDSNLRNKAYQDLNTTQPATQPSN